MGEAMRLEIGESLNRWLQRYPQFDQLAETLQDALRRGLQRGAPTTKQISDFFNGTWLGHSLHAVLTDFTIGLWTTAQLLDYAAIWSDDKGLTAGADLALTVGEVAVLPTALAGIADWQYTEGSARRVGLLHALINTTAAGLVGGSLVLRSRRRAKTTLPAAQVLSTVGYLVLLTGAQLGGDLAYRFGIAVNRQAWMTPIPRFTPVLDAEELREGKPRRVLTHGRSILLVKHGQQIRAIGETCTHMGGPLAEGAVEDGRVQCPWHASVFSLENGRVLEGPATAREPVYETRVHEGKIEVRTARTSSSPG